MYLMILCVRLLDRPQPMLLLLQATLTRSCGGPEVLWMEEGLIQKLQQGLICLASWQVCIC